MLIDVTKLIERPKGTINTPFVRLNVINKESLNVDRTTKKTRLRPDLPRETNCIVGKWKPTFVSILTVPSTQLYSDIIKNASRITNCITDYRTNITTRLNKRLEK